MKKGELFRWIGAALFVALGLLYIINNHLLLAGVLMISTGVTIAPAFWKVVVKDQPGVVQLAGPLIFLALFGLLKPV